MKISKIILCGYIVVILLSSLLISVMGDAKGIKLVPNNGNFDIRLTDGDNGFLNRVKELIDNILNNKVEVNEEVETTLSNFIDKILDKTGFKRGLVISTVDEIEEGKNLSILVTDYSGDPVAGASVSLVGILTLSEIYETNESGMVEIIAPNITSSQATVMIFAEKMFYIPGFKTLKIMDVDRTLTIEVEDKIKAGEKFDVIVKTSDGKIVENATVGFNGKNLSTDENGKVTFTAPPITNDRYYEITAEKEGYESAKADITVFGEETGFLSLIVGNWILMSAIIAVGVIALFAIWWYRQF